MMNDENITFLFYPFKLYEKFIIDELFRFSLAVSRLENDDEYRTFQDYPTYDPSYGPKFPASRKKVTKNRKFFTSSKSDKLVIGGIEKFCFRHSSSLFIALTTGLKRK